MLPFGRGTGRANALVITAARRASAWPGSHRDAHDRDQRWMIKTVNLHGDPMRTVAPDHRLSARATTGRACRAGPASDTPK
jgi:hypothetical protein